MLIDTPALHGEVMKSFLKFGLHFPCQHKSHRIINFFLQAQWCSILEFGAKLKRFDQISGSIALLACA